MSVAAWFPYYFVEPLKDKKDKEEQALGIDSLAIFFITHGTKEEHTAQAAEVNPMIGEVAIEKYLLQPEGHENWDETYLKGYDSTKPKENKRQMPWFLKLSPATGVVGQHCTKYHFPKDITLKEQLHRFLKPHTSWDKLEKL